MLPVYLFIQRFTYIDFLDIILNSNLFLVNTRFFNGWIVSYLSLSFPDLLNYELLESIIFLLLPQLHVQYPIYLTLKLFDKLGKNLLVHSFALLLLCFHSIKLFFQFIGFTLIWFIISISNFELSLNVFIHILNVFILSQYHFLMFFKTNTGLINKFIVFLRLLLKLIWEFAYCTFVFIQPLILNLQLLMHLIVYIFIFLYLLVLSCCYICYQLVISISVLNKLRLYLLGLLISLKELLLKPFVLILHLWNGISLRFNVLLQFKDFAVFLCKSLAEIVDHLEDVFCDQVLNIVQVIFDYPYLSLRHGPGKQCLAASFGFKHLLFSSLCLLLQVGVFIIGSGPLLVCWLLEHLLASSLRVYFLVSNNALMFTVFEDNSLVWLLAIRAFNHHLVACCFQMLLNFHSELDLLALRAGQALFRAVLV